MLLRGLQPRHTTGINGKAYFRCCSGDFNVDTTGINGKAYFRYCSVDINLDTTGINGKAYFRYCSVDINLATLLVSMVRHTLGVAQGTST